MTIKTPIAAQAYAIKIRAISMSGTHKLDHKTAVWVITYSAYRSFLEDMSLMSYGARDSAADLHSRNKTLLGIPVRITVEDDPETPEIQLLMEPLLKEPRK